MLRQLEDKGEIKCFESDPCKVGQFLSRAFNIGLETGYRGKQDEQDTAVPATPKCDACGEPFSATQPDGSGGYVLVHRNDCQAFKAGQDEAVATAGYRGKEEDAHPADIKVMQEFMLDGKLALLGEIRAIMRGEESDGVIAHALIREVTEWHDDDRPTPKTPEELRDMAERAEKSRQESQARKRKRFEERHGGSEPA